MTTTPEADLLSERHAEAITIAGTQKLHHFVPVSTSEVRVKPYTSTADFYVKKVSVVTENNVPDDEIKNYVTVEYEKEWWLGFVMEKKDDVKEAKIMFLHAKGPSNSFFYLNKADILQVPYNDILSAVDVMTHTGRTYMMTKNCQRKATCMLNNKL